MSLNHSPLEFRLEKGSRIVQALPDRSHIERHTNYGDVLCYVIIGFADGLTVPFALTAGLSSSVQHIIAASLLDHIYRPGSSNVMVIGGLAELFSGAISIGPGAYLAAVIDRDHYIAEDKREREEIRTRHEEEK